MQTINLLYLYLTGLQGVPVLQLTEPPHTLPLLVFWPQEKEDKLHPWAN